MIICDTVRAKQMCYVFPSADAKRFEAQVCGVNIGNHIFSGEKGDSENINIHTLEYGIGQPIN